MMKRLGFLETKRTPRYSMRKFNVGMASVLLGVTIFGINFTNHSVKAVTTESVTQKATSATEKGQQNGASNDATQKVQQNSGSNNATATKPTEAATTSQSAPKTADTDINSSAAKSAAKLALTNLVAMPGTDGNAAGQNDTNTHHHV